MMNEPINILSLDAGGVKGIYTALMIHNLGLKFKIDFHTRFDCYAGTSIGAVIATALAKGVDTHIITKKILEFDKLMHHGHIHLIQSLFEWIDYLFGNMKMSSVRPKIFLPVYNVSDKQNTYFTNDDKSNELYLSDILKATCADFRILAPRNVRGLPSLYADAGFFAYDPTLSLIQTYKEILKSKTNILSIGSGIIANVSNDLNKGELIDTIYDSFLTDQFKTTKLFFDVLSDHSQVNYLRISEFPLSSDLEFSLKNITELVDQRLTLVERSDLAHFI